MKKILTITGFSILLASQSIAQRITIGPEAGLNISNQVTKINGDRLESDPKLGLKIGGIVDIGLTRTFSIQPGLFFSQKGSKVEDVSYRSLGNLSYREMERYDTRLNYVELPLNLQFYFGRPRTGCFFVGGGPYVAFLLGGKEKYTWESRLADGSRAIIDSRSENYDLEIGDDAREDDVKGADAGLNFNLGYMTRHGFFVRGNMGVGLSNLLPGGDSDFRQNNIGGSVTMGFLIGH